MATLTAHHLMILRKTREASGIVAVVIAIVLAPGFSHGHQAFAHSFTDAVNLSNNSGNSIAPKIAVSGNNVYMTWIDDTPGKSSVFFKKSLDGGKTFSDTVRLNKVAAQVNSVDVVASGNNVYVLWVANVDGDYDIFFKRSRDGGSSFSYARNISNNTGASLTPVVVASNDTVYVAWLDDTNHDAGSYDVLYKKSKDSGYSFTTARSLSGFEGHSFELKLAATGNSVHVVWTNRYTTSLNGTEKSEILLTSSHDSGTTFGDPMTLASHQQLISDPLLSTPDEQTVYVLWKDSSSSTGDLIFSSSNNAGLSFGKMISLKDQSTDVQGAAIQDVRMESSGKNIFVVWDQCLGGENSNSDLICDVYLKRSTNGGKHFAAATNLSNDGSGTAPNIAISGKNVYIVWDDIAASSSPSNGQIFLKASKNKGSTFGEAERLTTNFGATDPVLTTSANKLYVSWVDSTNGNFDVLFSRMIRGSK